MVKRNLYSDFATSGGFGFDVFTEDEINKIHLATLEVLEKTGLYVGTQEAMDILEAGGVVIPMIANMVDAATKKLNFEKPAGNQELDGLRICERWWFA